MIAVANKICDRSNQHSGLTLLRINREKNSRLDLKNVTNETKLTILQIYLKHLVNRKDILIKFGHKTFNGSIQRALRKLREMV